MGQRRQRGGYEREVPDYRTPSPEARGLGGFTQTCPPLAKAKPIPGTPGLTIYKNGKGQRLPEWPGVEEEKAKKGPEGREPRF